MVNPLLSLLGGIQFKNVRHRVGGGGRGGGSGGAYLIKRRLCYHFSIKNLNPKWKR